jgi:hypothetical protein
MGTHRLLTKEGWPPEESVRENNHKIMATHLGLHPYRPVLSSRSPFVFVLRHILRAVYKADCLRGLSGTAVLFSFLFFF